MFDDIFRCSAVHSLSFKESVFTHNVRVREQDTCTEKEKALRVPRAVNIGWRFTARMQVGKIDHKNEDISEFVNSIDPGAIFLSRLAHELSRNDIAVSVYAF